MNVFTMLGTRYELKEKAYFDESIKEDLENPNPLLSALLKENMRNIRERVSNNMICGEQWTAILLPECNNTEPYKQIEIEGLTLFEPTMDALSDLRFTCYEK